MRVLLVTPPMTQLNAPYAAGPHLAGFLHKKGIEVVQADASLALALALFSRRGVNAVLCEVRKRWPRAGRSVPETIRHFVDRADSYANTVDFVVRFLQDKAPHLAGRMAGRAFLPEGRRFSALNPIRPARNGRTGRRDRDPRTQILESMDVSDRAKYLASLYIDDLADVIREGVDSRFELSRYGEKLAVSAPRFDPIRKALESKPSLIDRLLDRMADDLIAQNKPDLVGFTVPFPGNLYGALRLARRIKRSHPRLPVAMGGGYVNTELRELSDSRVFDYVDFVTLDAGERPLWNLIEYVQGKRPISTLCRTFVRQEGKVRFWDDASCQDVAFSDVGAPIYRGIERAAYISLCEMPNPMHRLWSDGRWNKLMLTHGCYWRKCAFCDTALDYIRRFDSASADELADRIEAVIKATGSRRFHFVDEATPPALLKGLAKRLISRGTKISWWTNIRFERAFSPALCRLLAKSGCVAVTGGVETVVNRLLRLMNKGISIEQATRTMKAFADSGIMVHAYLMYGFPSQTEQETVDALEIVRQLFEADCIQSAYWHRFALTVHSPISREPGRYGIDIRKPSGSFARNELVYKDSVRCEHDLLGKGLRKALYNYMHGVGLELDVRSWFPKRVPKPTIRCGFVRHCL